MGPVRLLAESKGDNIYQFSARDIDGKVTDLSKYEGQVCVVVNVASKWGLTKANYTQLVQLHEKYNQVSPSNSLQPATQHIDIYITDG